MAAISVDCPVYPQFPANKTTVTVLNDDGRYVTKIEDIPKINRRIRPVSERPRKGGRLLHRETLTLEVNPKLTGDNSTSYLAEFSGKRQMFEAPFRPQRYPSQLSSHVEIGVGSNFYGDTVNSATYLPISWAQAVKDNDQYACLANRTYQRYGANMKRMLSCEENFYPGIQTVYRKDILSTEPTVSFRPSSGPFQPQFQEKPPRRDVLTWDLDRRSLGTQDFKRISGNRVLAKYGSTMGLPSWR